MGRGRRPQLQCVDSTSKNSQGPDKCPAPSACFKRFTLAATTASSDGRDAHEQHRQCGRFGNGAVVAAATGS